MDWKKVIQRLKRRGWSQARIGEHCGVAQSTVSDLEHGRIKQPNFTVGTKLVELDRSGEKLIAVTPRASAVPLPASRVQQRRAARTA